MTAPEFNALIDRIRDAENLACRHGIAHEMRGHFEEAKRVDTPELVALVAALSRQNDNMAFIINHATLPELWADKFVAELKEDRAALAALGSKR
jgi:hypothetical protein